MQAKRFAGFPAETFALLEGMAAHNDKAWFEANRDLYEAGYIEPGRAFVETVGPKLEKISPGVQYVPKVNGSLSRINRDIRFAKDKRPYKTHLDLWFWHGERRGWETPGFYFRLTADQVWIGVGMHQMPKDMLARYRDAVVDPRAGKALAAAVSEVEAAGYAIGAATRKQVPRGYPADHPLVRYLMLDGLNAGIELLAAAAKRDDFADICVGHFKACWPVGKWTLDEVVA